MISLGYVFEIVFWVVVVLAFVALGAMYLLDRQESRSIDSAQPVPGTDWLDEWCAKHRCPKEFFECDICGGSGIIDNLHEIDPLWYDEGYEEDCEVCQGDGGWTVCDLCAAEELKGSGTEQAENSIVDVLISPQKESQKESETVEDEPLEVLD